MLVSATETFIHLTASIPFSLNVIHVPTGEYLVDVFYYGKPIPGSPYRVHAFDWNRITIRNLRNQGMINRVVEFDSQYLRHPWIHLCQRIIINKE